MGGILVIPAGPRDQTPAGRLSVAPPTRLVEPWSLARGLRYPPRVDYYLFNFAEGSREQAAALLDERMWGVGGDERDRDALAPGDLALIFVATPEGQFIGRAELTTRFHEWTPEEAGAYPGDLAGGVLLSDVEAWEPAVPLETVVQRIDPTASNPIVQENALLGFRRGVVGITRGEYEAGLALSREARRNPPVDDQAEKNRLRQLVEELNAAEFEQLNDEGPLRTRLHRAIEALCDHVGIENLWSSDLDS